MNENGMAAIVVGANGGIGNAIMHRLLRDPQIDHVFAISRNVNNNPDSNDGATTWLKSDSSEDSINNVCEHISRSGFSLRYIVIATGILQNQEQGIQPEKCIEAVSSKLFEEVFSVNTFIPLIWLSHFTGLLDKTFPTNIAVLSARVGSISDNRLGGWYSYRASKAALNMLLKTLAIEYKRRFPKTKITSFHPGTTDTGLSRPFQAGIPDHKLFSTEYVAERLHELLQTSHPDGALSFQDWEHKTIRW